MGRETGQLFGADAPTSQCYKHQHVNLGGETASELYSAIAEQIHNDVIVTTIGEKPIFEQVNRIGVWSLICTIE